MNIARYCSSALTTVGLMCLCACATRHSIRPELPPETDLNQDAGRGGYVRLPLHLEGGETINGLLDTGSPVTFFQSSLEPKLGERLSGGNWYGPINGPRTNGLYWAPKLYLGPTPLRTGEVVFTHDSGPEPVILGMDTLRHYCIQLDFAARKVRFLDPDTVNLKDLGEAFPLNLSRDGQVRVHTRFLGLRHWEIDTGAPLDAVMQAADFERASRSRQLAAIGTKVNGLPNRSALFPTAVFGTNTYSELCVGELPPHLKRVPNLIGLNFLARHLVTFDFPKHKLYLKQVTEEPLDLADYLTLQANLFLMSLEQTNHLPGWSKSIGPIDWLPEAGESATYPVSRTFKFHIGGWVDITAQVRGLAASSTNGIRVDNSLVGRDPAPYIVKQLRVEFRHDGRQQTAEVTEGKTLALPAGAEVVTARYGHLPPKTAKPCQEEANLSTYHYTVVRESKTSPWKVQKAWRTDANERVLEEYSAP